MQELDLDNGPDLFAWEKAIRTAELSPMAKLLALLLRTYLNRRTAEWSIGVTRLACEMGVCRETVKRARRELVATDFLRVTGRTGQPNRYRATLPSAPARLGERIRAPGVSAPVFPIPLTTPLTTHKEPHKEPRTASVPAELRQQEWADT